MKKQQFFGSTTKMIQIITKQILKHSNLRQEKQKEALLLVIEKILK